MYYKEDIMEIRYKGYRLKGNMTSTAILLYRPYILSP